LIDFPEENFQMHLEKKLTNSSFKICSFGRYERHSF